jgi:hypothetical protein
MMTPPREAPELGRDALDLAEPPALWTRLFPARRPALGLQSTAAPTLTFVVIGFLLGPNALDVLTPEVVARLNPVVSIGLAALGVFIGLGIGRARPQFQSALLMAALLEVSLTILVVAGAMYVLLVRWAIPLPIDPLLFAIVAGICCSASAATRVVGTGAAARVTWIVDLDDAPLVVLGTVAVALAGSRPVGMGMVLTVAAGLLVGIAGWLLFERARGEAERGVFVGGAIALAGGIGAYVGMSPLLSGAAAAIVWVWSPGGADRIIETDLRKLHHPLVALLLIVAGASIQWQYALLWIAAPLVLVRLIGKLLASMAAARLAAVSSGLLATVLLPPGVVGVAIALNVQQILGTEDTLLLSAVTVAAAVSELLPPFLSPGTLEESHE